MTIDTSREAVERLNTHRVYINRTMCFDEGVTWTTVAGLYPHAYVPEDFALALLAERDAALAEVARLSTPPDDAEVRVLESWLRNPWSTAANNVERGPIPDWLYALMNQAADALAAETAKREAMEEALRDMLHETGGGTRATNNAVATLAKYGSKT